jgi:hypothetical protein
MPVQAPMRERGNAIAQALLTFPAKTRIFQPLIGDFMVCMADEGDEEGCEVVECVD